MFLIWDFFPNVKTELIPVGTNWKQGCVRGVKKKKKKIPAHNRRILNLVGFLTEILFIKFASRMDFILWMDDVIVRKRFFFFKRGNLLLNLWKCGNILKPFFPPYSNKKEKNLCFCIFSFSLFSDKCIISWISILTFIFLFYSYNNNDRYLCTLLLL